MFLIRVKGFWPSDHAITRSIFVFLCVLCVLGGKGFSSLAPFASFAVQDFPILIRDHPRKSAVRGFVVKGSLLFHDQFLAGNAIAAPRYRSQSIHADVLAAMQAFAERAVV